MFGIQHSEQLNRIELKLDELLRGQRTIMSAITDWAAKEATALASIQTGIANLDTLIQNFQNSSGTLSATDQAALDAISATSASLAAAANDVPSPVVVPAPTVPTT